MSLIRCIMYHWLYRDTNRSIQNICIAYVIGNLGNPRDLCKLFNTFFIRRFAYEVKLIFPCFVGVNMQISQALIKIMPMWTVRQFYKRHIYSARCFLVNGKFEYIYVFLVSLKFIINLEKILIMP
jgi:hypothetical protein